MQMPACSISLQICLGSSFAAPAPRLHFCGRGFSVLPPRKARGVERRQAPVRIAAPCGPPCGWADLRIAADRRPMTLAGAPLGAPPRLCSGVSSASVPGRAFVRTLPGSSASSWQAARSGQPGGAPRPPECLVCETRPAGAAPAGVPDFPVRRHQGGRFCAASPALPLGSSRLGSLRESAPQWTR